MLNNNVVLARDEIGREAILTGRGLGFQRKRGQDVDTSLISRRYIPADNARSVAEVIGLSPGSRWSAWHSPNASSAKLPGSWERRFPPRPSSPSSITSTRPWSGSAKG